MPDLNEIEALKASLRGAQHAAADLASVATKTAALDPDTDIADDNLDALQRLSLANAVAAEALRGLVETMLKRRGRLPEMATTGGTAADEER